MSSVLAGTALWPGAEACIECVYTCTHGAQPSAAMFVMPAQPLRPPVGAGQLRIEDSLGRVVRMDGCKIDRLDVLNNGALWRLTILDRRWKLKFGTISGTYNDRDDNQELVAGHKLSARGLAILCLIQMGETVLNADDMPDDEFPPVVWEGANPASALEQLAAPFDCRIVYRPSADILVVARRGVGFGLPDLPAMMIAPTLDFPERPDSIVFLGGPSEYETLIPLEAVGLDADGEVKPINELLCKPAGGWLEAPPGDSGNLTRLAVNPAFDERSENDLNEAVRALFEQTVYKWYRIKAESVNGFGGPLVVPGYGEVNDRERLIISDRRVQSTLNVDGTLVAKPAEVRGRFWAGRQRLVAASDEFENSHPSELLAASFSVDPGRGLVMFSEPVVANFDNTAEPAQLFLLCSVRVKAPISSELVRYSRILQGSDADLLGTGPEIVGRPEVVLKVVTRYELEPLVDAANSVARWKVVRLTTNGAAVDAASAYWLALTAAKYERVPSETRDYPGIIPIAPDGAIHQITWAVGNGPPRTTASRNAEHAVRLPSFEELRRVRFTREQMGRPEFGPAPPPPGQASKAVGKNWWF